MEKEPLFTYGNHRILKKWEMFESEKKWKCLKTKGITLNTAYKEIPIFF